MTKEFNELMCCYKIKIVNIFKTINKINNPPKLSKTVVGHNLNYTF